MTAQTTHRMDGRADRNPFSLDADLRGTVHDGAAEGFARPHTAHSVVAAVMYF
jgi:hypothetical protein